jgi:hypothetical protein
MVILKATIPKNRSLTRQTIMHWKIISVLALLSVSTSVQAAVELTGNFDSGSLKSYSVNGNTIDIVGRDTYSTGGFSVGDGAWRWLYFKASGVLNQNLTFAVHGEFAGDGPNYDDPSIEADHELYDHEMVYSYDGENWQFFRTPTIRLARPTPIPTTTSLLSG